jgi:hypothetical protein
MRNERRLYVKHRSDLLTKAIAASLAITGIAIILAMTSSCASAPPSKRVTRCLADPGNNSMHCDGVSIPWGDHFRNFVCHDLDDEKFLIPKASP